MVRVGGSLDNGVKWRRLRRFQRVDRLRRRTIGQARPPGVARGGGVGPSPEEVGPKRFSIFCYV